jgi:D-alanyl-D-alanine dipeptidase
MANTKKIDIESLAKKEVPQLSSVSGWKEIPVQPSSEPLVPLGLSSNFNIFTSSIYFSEHDNSPYLPNQLSGSLITIFIRQGVAERLIRAEEMLPRGYHLVVFDGWRPLEVQKSLYDEYYQSLKTKFPSWGEDKLVQETQKYVSLPSNNPSRPSPHNTGGAVDLALMQLPESAEEKLKDLPIKNQDTEIERAKIILASAKLLNFGTQFDWGGSEAALRHLEELAEQRELSEEEKEALANRRVLYYLMKEIGLEAYADEWWHYNAPQTQMGAKTAGLAIASYGAIEISSSDFQLELSRRKLAERIGRNTVFPKAAIIKPPEK